VFAQAAAEARSSARDRRLRARAASLLPAPGERLLPLLSGLLLVLSFPPFELLVPPFVALVPFLVFLAERPVGPVGRWSAIRGGYLLGLVYFGLLLYWLIVALIYYTPLAILAWLVAVVVLAGFVALFAAGVVWARERVPAVPLALSAALFWTTLEWVQGHLGDISFPWLGLGTALSGFPRVAGAADLVGARGLTFWLVLVNGLVASAIVAARRQRSPLRPALLALLAIGIPAGYGFWRAATLPLTPAARVAVVQPNIPEDVKMDVTRALDSSMVALTNLTRRIPPGSVDLVVWPEVAVQSLVDAPTPHQTALRGTIQRLARDVKAPILVGMYGYSVPPGDTTFTYYNAARVMTSGGFRGPEYDKQYLVPIVERVPFIDPRWLEHVTGPLRWFGGLGRGPHSELLPAGNANARLGALICYESIFAPLSRTYRREGAAFLVNMTNDSWYGREEAWARTSALWQHPAHLVMRAIENRVGVARSANTGFSLFVDPLGHTYQRTRLFVPDVRIATVYTTGTTTLFTRLGDWLAQLAVAGSVLLLIACWMRGRGASKAFA
jgi:apolipoprotein N-acyltransferase